MNIFLGSNVASKGASRSASKNSGQLRRLKRNSWSREVFIATRDAWWVQHTNFEKRGVLSRGSLRAALPRVVGFNVRCRAAGILGAHAIHTAPRRAWYVSRGHARPMPLRRKGSALRVVTAPQGVHHGRRSPIATIAGNSPSAGLVAGAISIAIEIATAEAHDARGEKEPARLARRRARNLRHQRIRAGCDRAELAELVSKLAIARPLLRVVVQADPPRELRAAALRGLRVYCEEASRRALVGPLALSALARAALWAAVSESFAEGALGGDAEAVRLLGVAGAQARLEGMAAVAVGSVQARPAALDPHELARRMAALSDDEEEDNEEDEHQGGTADATS